MRPRASALALIGLIACAAAADAPRRDGPEYTADGQLRLPANYREWIFLSAGLGMTYGNTAPRGEPRFDNVFVNPSAYRAFLETGSWPDQTVFMLEVRASATAGSINKGGHFQDAVTALEVHLKDTTKFPATKWGFFQFEPGATTAKPLTANSSCQKCHAQHGAVDETFVQFYPTLVELAKTKGTFKASPEK